MVSHCALGLLLHCKADRLSKLRVYILLSSGQLEDMLYFVNSVSDTICFMGSYIKKKY